jgi:hypothetical protein
VKESCEKEIKEGEFNLNESPSKQAYDGLGSSVDISTQRTISHDVGLAVGSGLKSARGSIMSEHKAWACLLGVVKILSTEFIASYLHISFS